MPADSSSSRRGKIIAIFVVAALAVAGGAYWLFTIYLPQEKRGPAQAEITRWEGRLAEARACLLGPSPASSNTREALAIRELAPDPWNRTTCTQLIGKLSRGETEDTGILDVEEAWRGLDRAAGKVGAAFLAHVDPAGEPAKNRRADALPVALDELDAAHAALRATAEMAPPPARPATKPLPTAELIPLRDGAEPIKKLDSWTMPSMNSVLAFTQAASHEVQLALVPGAAPVARRIGAGVLRTVPDAAWGAVARVSLSKGEEVNQVIVGPLDEHGEPPGLPPDQDPRKRKDAVPVDGRASVFAVVGTADDGLAVAGSRNALVLVRSQGQKLVADKPIEIEQLAFAIDPAGRALVAYNDADGALRGFIARGAAPVKPIELGAVTAGGACLTAKRAFIAGPSTDQAVSFDTETGAVTQVDAARHDLLGCTTEAALLHQRDSSHYTVCGTDCRIAVLQGMRPSKIATLAGDQVVAAVVRDQVLGVWREKGPPTYYGVGKQVTLQFAVSDGKVIDLVAETGDGLAIVRVPAK
jgi:hypothetical protein